MVTNAMPGFRDDDIKKALDYVGITPNYKGFPMLTLAIALAAEDNRRMYNLRDGIYDPIACSMSCSVSSVGRNIRTAIRVSWKFDPTKLFEIFGTADVLDRAPNNARFIARMVRFVGERSKQ